MSSSDNFTAIATLAFIVAYVPVNLVYTFSTENTSTVTVIEKDRMNNRNNSKYILTTKDDAGKVHVFKNTDKMFRGKFRSADLQGEIEVGCKYQFNHYGVRNGLLSMFPNVYDIQKISCDYSQDNAKAPSR